jgi:hypothetical protein
MPLRRFLAPFLALFATVAFAADAPPPPALATLDDATFASRIATSLEAKRNADAYFYARAWQHKSPRNFGAAAALSRVYLSFGAPAAALESVSHAFLLAPNLEAARELLAFKIQAHAELGDSLAALANAREALRLPAEPDEAFTASLVALQWAAYATLLSEPALAAHAARTEAPGFAHRPFLTKERLLNQERDLHESFRQRLARASENREAIFAELTRYLALNEHFGPWADPAGASPPLAAHPDLLALYEPYLEATDLPVYGRWVKNNRLSVLEDPPADEPAAAGNLAADLPRFLQTIEPLWSRLRPQLEQGVAQADAARLLAEIEAAWDQLERLMNGSVANVLKQIDALFAQLEVTPDAAPGSAVAAFAQWRDLGSDPLVAAARLRGVQRASGNAVVAEADIPQLKADGAWMGIEMTEAEAAPSLFRRWARAVLAEEEARLTALQTSLADAPSPRLEDFDTLIAQSLMTPATWRARLRAAEAGGDWSEQVWSAYHAFAEDPAALDRWLSPRLQENDALLAGAIAALESDNQESRLRALDDLLRGLDRDPAHLVARTALMQAFLRDGLDEAAHEQLVTLWRMHLPSFRPDTDALSLIVRRSDWPFLLEVADDRVTADDTDVEAHFYRQLAATALGFPQLAADSTTALNGTVYHTRTRLLHWMDPEYVKRNPPLVSYENEYTGLKDVVDLLGSDDEDPSALIWLALLLDRHPAEFPSYGNLTWQRLETDASLATITHLDFIRGRLSVTDYRETHRDTDEDAVAQFVERHLAATRSPSDENAARLTAMAGEPALPLLLRVAAATVAGHRNDATPPTQRASARAHVNPRTKDWTGVWSNLAPGQKAVVATIPDLKAAPTDRPLRVEALPNLGLVLSAPPLEIGPLWELRGLHVRREGTTGIAPAWQVRNGHVLAVAEAHASGLNLNTSARNATPGMRGHVWLEEVEWAGATIAANYLWLDDVFLSAAPLHIGRRLDASTVHAPNLSLSLGGHANVWGRTHAHACFEDSVVQVTAQDTLAIVAGSTLHFERSTVFDNQATAQRSLGFASGAVSAHAGRHITARTDASSPDAGFVSRLLDHADAVTAQVGNAGELIAALAKAKAGDRIFLRGGVYELTATLRVPAGVSLIGSYVTGSAQPTTLSVGARRQVDPVVLVEGGLSRLARLHFDVPSAGVHQPTGIRLRDQIPDRKAIVVRNRAHVVLENVAFPGWDGMVRPAVVADGAHIIVMDALTARAAVANGGTLSLLAGIRGYADSFEGQGHVHAPYRGTGRPGEGLTIKGDGLHFHHRAPSRFYVRYYDGGAPPRDLARRVGAREQLLAALANSTPALDADLSATKDIDERGALLSHHIGSHSHLIRAARMSPAALAQAFARHLNPILLKQRDDLPVLIDRMVYENRALEFGFLDAYQKTFPEVERQRIAAFGRIHYNPWSRDGAGSTRDRKASLAFLDKYPPGHPLHARAMKALGVGQQTPAEFEQTLAREAAEAAARMAAAIRAEEARKAQEAYQARLRVEQEAARKRQAELALLPVARSANWGSGWSSGSSSSSSYRPYQPSASRQLQDYSRQLDNHIHNVGRGYGQGRRY